MAYINLKKVLQVVKTQTAPAVYQEKTITPQNQTREITADAGYQALSKVILNGLLVDPHESYTSSTDATTAYTKTVPAGALKYATLDKLGGMSYKSDNLADEQDGGILTNGTIYQQAQLKSSSYIPVNEGESYVNNIVPWNTTNFCAVAFYDNSKEIVSYILGNVTSSTIRNITIPSGVSYMKIGWNNNTQSNPIQLNKGTTLLPYQPHFEGIRDSAVTSVVGEDTLTIPAEVQALEGYGFGINDTCYNYIDYETKKFIKKVARVDLGSLTWTISNGCFYVIIDNKLGSSNLLKISNNYTELTDRYSSLGLYNSSLDKVVCCDYGQTSKIILAKDTSYTSSSDFKTAMSGVYLYYELATPVETDISEYIENNFIEVEPNGTITFNNTYNQAVPSEVTYLVEV